MNEWVRKLDRLIHFLRESSSPITLLIGAGASYSSNGPRTKEVLDELHKLTGGHVTAESIRVRCEFLTQPEKTAMIEKFFRTFKPYIGYRCLAAMARLRRVFVLNLNWDEAVEQACAVLNVACASIDIEDTPAAEIQRLVADEKIRVICVHLHGKLGGRPRVGAQETLKFDGDKRQVLLESFFRNPTLIMGALLRQDTDMLSLLADIEREGMERTDGSGRHPVWFLSREARSRGSDGAMLRMLQARHSEDNLVEHPAVDFDRAKLYLHTELAGVPFDSYRKENEVAGLPVFERIAFPQPSILRPHLDAPAIVLRGEPGLGKSTIAHLLTFFFKALSVTAKGDAVDAHHVAGTTYCASALGNVRPRDILLLEEPFGPTDRFQQNPSFLRGLQEKLALESSAGGRVLVTSRTSTWEAGMADYCENAQQRLFCPIPTVSVVSDVADDWYSREDLLAFLGHQEDGGFIQLVEDGILNTPGRIIDALEAGTPALVFSGETIKEKRATFERLGLEKLSILTLLRLQQMSSHTHTWESIVDHAGLAGAEDLKKELSSSVVTFELDGVYARLRHSTDAEAIDACLADANSPLSERIRQLALRHEWIDEALHVREAIRAVETRRYDDIVKELGPAPLDEWAPEFLAVAGDADILKHLDRSMDLWALRDFAYQLVRLWPALRDSDEAQATMEKLLTDRPRQGLYAVAEAALCLQKLTHPEVWTLVEAELWRRYRQRDEHTFELALVFDALFWRRSPDRLHDAEWVRRFMKTNVESPIRGAFAFSVTFHSNAVPTYMASAQAFEETIRLLHEMTPEQGDLFCHMSRWHFIHESRDRALLQRRDQMTREFAEYLRRTSFENGAVDERERRILLTAITRMIELRHAGTAFYLVVAMAAIWGHRAELTREHRRMLENVPDRDRSALAAVMNYEIPAELLTTAQKYFQRPPNREQLLDAFAFGLTLDGTHLDWPRFDYCIDPFKVMQRLQIAWPALAALNAPLDDRGKFRGWAKAMAGPAASDAVRQVIRRAVRGDLRLLEETAAALLLKMPVDAARLHLFESAVAKSGTPAMPQEPRLSIQRTEPLELDTASLSTLLTDASTTQNLVRKRHLLDELLTKLDGRGGEFRPLRARALALSGQLHLRAETSSQSPHMAIDQLRAARTLWKDLGDEAQFLLMEKQLKDALWQYVIKPSAPGPFLSSIRNEPLEVWDATIAFHTVPVRATARHNVSAHRTRGQNRWKLALERARKYVRGQGPPPPK